MSQTERIKDIASRLHRQELAPEEKHIGASMEPVYGEDSDLSALSRLITGRRDICTALCLEEGTLLISNNSGDQSYPLKMLELITNLVQNPFKENFANLEEAAQQRSLEIKDEYISRIKKIDDVGLRRQFIHASTPEDFEKIARNSKLPQNIRDIAITILQPVQDARKIAAKISSGELEPNLEEALLQKKRIFIEKEEPHAEMNILSYLSKTGKLQPGAKFDLGISKLCCVPCYATIQGLKDTKDITIITPGTHGGSYPGWTVNDVLLQEAAISVLEKIPSDRSLDQLPYKTFESSYRGNGFELAPPKFDFETKHDFDKHVALLNEKKLELESLREQIDLSDRAEEKLLQIQKIIKEKQSILITHDEIEDLQKEHHRLKEKAAGKKIGRFAHELDKFEKEQLPLLEGLKKQRNNALGMASPGQEEIMARIEQIRAEQARYRNEEAVLEKESKVDRSTRDKAHHLSGEIRSEEKILKKFRKMRGSFEAQRDTGLSYQHSARGAASSAALGTTTKMS